MANGGAARCKQRLSSWACDGTDGLIGLTPGLDTPGTGRVTAGLAFDQGGPKLGIVRQGGVG
jgi:hypothetical protein